MKALTPEILADTNLLLLADLLEQAEERHAARHEPRYNQHQWMHECGTPSCAIGHWLASQGQHPAPRDLEHIDQMRKDFGVNDTQWADLFGSGHARTAQQEAQLIRNFVAMRRDLRR